MNRSTENYTRNIYTLIGDENYNEVLKTLEGEMHNFPDSTAIHSLMAYCYWQLEDYAKACTLYEKLVKLNPTSDQYKLLHAQCLYKTANYYEAIRISFGIQSPEYKSKAVMLQVAIRYAENDILSAKSILAENDQEDEDVMVDTAIILFKEDRFEEALDKYMEIKRIHGFKPEIAYSIALCYYRMNRFNDAISYINEVKQNIMRSHPEYLRSIAGEAVDFDVAGSLQKIQDLYLVETFNLLMSIEYDQKHFREAKEALHEIPTRSDEDLDSVTLHNTALCTMDEDPSAAFSKLGFLMEAQPPLSETFRNLLLGYCKYDYFSLASDLLAENMDVAKETMGQPMLDYLEAVLMCITSKEEGYRKFDELCKVKADIIRRVLRQIEEARKTQDENVNQLELELEANIDELIPILMAQARIFWDLGKYELVELLLMKYSDFCYDNRTWKLNMAHTYFLQPDKVMQSIQLYEPLVLEEQNLLDIEAILVANLCVAYVITDQNGLADTLINRITEEEQQRLKEDPNARLYHLSIVQLVIGTLYCAHKNFEFGVDYVFKAFKPMDQKLNPDTWFYAKKCLFELLRCIAYRYYIIPDPVFENICNFLDEADKYGKKIQSIIDLTIAAEDAHESQTVSFEARTIKAMLLRLYNY